MSNLAARLRARREALRPPPPAPVEGLLTRMVGLTLEAVGCQAAVGAHCEVIAPGDVRIEAEVVGFATDKLYLMPTGEIHGLVPNARVIPIGETHRVPVSDELLGRVLDGSGKPLDGMPSLAAEDAVPLQGPPINPLRRRPISDTLDVGIRAINSLLTVGRGQRLGLFAAAGVGKSSLLGMMTRYTEADVVVVGLIGERGREVKEFIEDTLGAEGLARAVVVAAPADTSPLMRVHGAMLTHSIAEHFRDRGKNVLLLMDSLTRFAQAQREIGLAIDEPPTTKGYPPSVFAKLPRLVERAGNGCADSDAGRGGSITAFYTVLVEGEYNDDPIADAARAILDGHIVLSREIAEAGIYPAIDIEASISRAMHSITDARQQKLAQTFRQLYAGYRQNRDLISVGAYQKGSDPAIDLAIQYQPKLRQFIAQSMGERVDSAASLAQLAALLSPPQQDAGQGGGQASGSPAARQGADPRSAGQQPGGRPAVGSS